MQTLVYYSKKLEPVPERFRELDRAQFAVPECQTPRRALPGIPRREAALLRRAQRQAVADDRRVSCHSLLGDQRPAAGHDTGDSERLRASLMEGIGLSGREVGLNAMVVAHQAPRGAGGRGARRRIANDRSRARRRCSRRRGRETDAALAACPGDVVVLGAGGKMGPTLARMARRAAARLPARDGRVALVVGRARERQLERGRRRDRVARPARSRRRRRSCPTRRT